MRHLILSSIYGAIAIAAVAAMPRSASAECASAFGTQVPQEMKWREASTHFLSASTFATSKAREAEIAKRQKLMENEVLGIGVPGDTPPIELFAADGVGEKYHNHTTGVSGVPTRIEISKIGPSGILKATMLLPVSGHTGAANAQAWAKTDTYSLTVDVSSDTAGNQWTGEQSLVKDAKSLGLVTAQDVELQLVKGKMVRVLYYRSGSGGPMGYWDGRVIELLWDGT